jgi:hypothetical protein
MTDHATVVEAIQRTNVQLPRRTNGHEHCRTPYMVLSICTAPDETQLCCETCTIHANTWHIRGCARDGNV